MKFAQVVILKKSGGFDDDLTYSIPEELESECRQGSFAEIPFHNRSVIGVVTAIRDDCTNLSLDRIKPISRIISYCTLNKEQIKITRFVSAYYKTSMGRALKLFLPKQVWGGDLKPPAHLIYRQISTDITIKGEKQKIAIEAISKGGGEASSEFLKNLNISSATLKSLIQKSVIQKHEIPFFRQHDASTNIVRKPDKILSSDQAEILKQIDSADKPILLHGITGSGKTEIYLRRILSALQKGKQVIYLVPEIALTPQTINYFKDYIGDNVAVFHSKLSDGQRAREWWRVKSGNANLIIGSRSAIFAPVADLGLIILDEEHEWTYKQESAPYYETHRIAEEMQKLWNAELILGSATPKAESYEKAKSGKYVYLELKERINKSELPLIHIVDLRDEFKKRNFSIFSLILQNKIRERLEKHEQIILFVNQRGLANAVVCRECGYTEKCPNCEISLKLHRNFANSKFEILNPKSFEFRASSFEFNKPTPQKKQFTSKNIFEKLICHYCNYTKTPELICPQCRSPYIKNVGVGTQRVEEEVKRLFPEARVIRADRDTTENSEGFSPIYKNFLEHKYDILVGTQMVAKGLDFSKVSLIGIILADIGLHIPDFRSHERLFQLIIQVAGRCGRGTEPGEVVLQTYQPEHPAIRKAAGYEYETFAETELGYRKKLSYPPFERMIKFTVVGDDEEKLKKHINTEVQALEDICKINDLHFKIYSAPAIVPRISNRFYHHVLIKAPDPNKIFLYWKSPKYWRIDVDPVHTV